MPRGGPQRGGEVHTVAAAVRPEDGSSRDRGGCWRGQGCDLANFPLTMTIDLANFPQGCDLSPGMRSCEHSHHRPCMTMPLQQDPFRGRSGQQVVLVSGGAPLRADPAMEERMAQMKAVVVMLVKTTVYTIVGC